MDKYEKCCWGCKKILNAEVDGDPYWSIDYMQSNRKFGCAPMGSDSRTYCEECFLWPNSIATITQYDRRKLKEFIANYFLHYFSDETLEKIINCIDEFFENEKNNSKDTLIAQLQQEALERSKFSTAILNAQLGSSYDTRRKTIKPNEKYLIPLDQLAAAMEKIIEHPNVEPEKEAPLAKIIYSLVHQIMALNEECSKLSDWIHGYED